jgi:GTP cyclohydrolase II
MNISNDSQFSAVRAAVRPPRVELASAAALPTEFGNFRIHVFTSDRDDREQVAIVHGDVFGAEAVATRLHSECLTGDVLASLRCDCRKQLELGLRQIASMPCGVLLYLRQEGRGIGLANKIRAYKLQEQGLDTVDANLALGFLDDERDYGVAVSMLRTLGVRSVRLMTNNPDKVAQLRRYGLDVTERVAHAIPPGTHNRRYLQTKAKRSGHILDVSPDANPDATPDAG